MRAKVVRLTGGAADAEIYREAGRILQGGGLVAFPTETVYVLGGNALDPASSLRIYAAKGRPSDNPLIVHIADMDSLFQAAANVPEEALRLAERYWPGPLTMIFEKKDCVPVETTGGLDSVAVRFPSHPAAQALIREAGGFVAAPSANTSGRPSPTCAAHVAEDLGDRIDMILDGGPVNIGLESTIVDFTGDVPMILRPGWLNREMLEEVLGEVRVDPGLLKDDPSVRPKAPGMRYRHYAPKAKLVIVEGTPEAVAGTIRELAAKGEAEGKKVGIICAEENLGRYPAGCARCIGSRADEKTIAQHLYGLLRDFDAEDADLIYSESYYTPQLGGAIMNRLIRAAGHTVIQASENNKTGGKGTCLE